MNAWATTCRSAPNAATGVNRATPRTMYDSWLIVENASPRLRLSCRMPTTPARIIVAAANIASGRAIPSAAVVSGPKTYSTLRVTAKAPLLTTATACSRPETGVGATIAVGSHAWNGTTAALTPKPATSSANATRPSVGSARPSAAIPPGTNERLDAPACTSRMPPSARTPPPRVYPRYSRPALRAFSSPACATSG